MRESFGSWNGITKVETWMCGKCSLDFHLNALFLDFTGRRGGHPSEEKNNGEMTRADFVTKES